MLMMIYKISETYEHICYRLQELIPSITGKDNITSLDIILEAIRYIDTLQDTLAHKISTGEIVFVKDDREETG